MKKSGRRFRFGGPAAAYEAWRAFRLITALVINPG